MYVVSERYSLTGIFTNSRLLFLFLADLEPAVLLLTLLSDCWDSNMCYPA